jgi:hypothetical protein
VHTSAQTEVSETTESQSRRFREDRVHAMLSRGGSEVAENVVRKLVNAAHHRCLPGRGCYSASTHKLKVHLIGEARQCFVQGARKTAKSWAPGHRDALAYPWQPGVAAQWWSTRQDPTSEPRPLETSLRVRVRILQGGFGIQ